MKKTGLVVFRRSQMWLLLLEDGRVLDQKNYVIGSLLAAQANIKSFFKHSGSTIKECVCCIDDEAQYYRATVPEELSKEALRKLWEVSADFSLAVFQRDLPEGKKQYYGLSYAPQILEPYISIIKKIGITCNAVIPLDFLLIGHQLGIYAYRVEHNLAVTAFDLNGGYYSTLMQRPASNKATERLLNNVLAYVKRESIVGSLTNIKDEPYDLELALPQLDKIKAGWVLYEYASDVVSIRKRLTHTQKALLAFLMAVLFVLIGAFSLQAYRGWVIYKDITTYRVQLNKLEPQARVLREKEQNIRYLKSRILENNKSLQALLAYCQKQNVKIKGLTLARDKKIITLIGYDQDLYRDKLIKDLQNDKFFESVTLIYIVPAGDLTEFKLVIKVR